jgi:hypothetical protein
VTVGVSTVSSAIDTAHTRSLWDPLTFDVMDLQLISCVEDLRWTPVLYSYSSGNSGSSNNNNFEPNQPVSTLVVRPRRPHLMYTSIWAGHTQRVKRSATAAGRTTVRRHGHVDGRRRGDGSGTHLKKWFDFLSGSERPKWLENDQRRINLTNRQ